MAALGLYMLACVWIFVGTLVGFNRIASAPTLAERLRPGAALLVQALPLMVAFFILFPRMQGPLWALPQDSRAGASGLPRTAPPSAGGAVRRSGGRAPGWCSLRKGPRAHFPARKVPKRDSFPLPGPRAGVYKASPFNRGPRSRR